MKTLCITLTFFVLFFLSPCEGLLVAKPIADKQIIQQNLPSRQLTFTRNDGQIDTHGKADCRFSTDVGGGRFYFCPDGVVSDFQQGSREAHASWETSIEAPTSTLTEARGFNNNPHEAGASRELVKGHVLKLNFVNRTNFAAEITGENEQEYKCNYFIGSVSSKWHTNVPNYSRVVYNNVWQGIDVEYYGADVARVSQPANAIPMDRDRATLEYDVIVHPGADPSQIQFAYEGGEGVSVNNGALIIKTSLGDVTEQNPYVYQIIDGKKREISSRFIVSQSGTFSFKVGEYDNTKDLIIDPIYSTLFGCKGGYGSISSTSIEADHNGNAYITGGTANYNDFPVTTGAYQTTNKGGTDVFIAKFNSEGSALIYSTYLGGSGDESGVSIKVDSSGNVYITGSTTSKDFPVTSGAFQTHSDTTLTTSIAFSDVFVTKLNASGSALLYSTYLSGLLKDYGSGIAIDESGCAYVTGYTSSTNFPVSSNAYQKSYGGGGPVLYYDDGNRRGDAFVTKLNASGSMLYSTYLGGAADDISYGIAVDNNNAYVMGSTNSINFPVTPGAHNTSYTPAVSSQQKDIPVVFVTKLNALGTSLVFSTYLGTSQSSGVRPGIWGTGITVNKNGNVFVTGETAGGIPATQGVYKDYKTQSIYNEGFVTKFDSFGSSLVYSTYMGSPKPVASGCKGIVLDGDGNACVITYGRETILKLDSEGSSLIYYSSDSLSSAGVAADDDGNVYVTGQAFPRFSTTPGAYQEEHYPGAGTDACVVKIGLSPRIVVADTFDMGRISCGSTQKTFSFQNVSEVGLRIDSLRIEDTTNFALVSSTSFPILISQDSLGQIVINFKAGTVGPKTTTLRVYSNDHTPLSDSLKKVVIIGVVDSLNHPFVIDAKNLDFGSLGCEASSRELQVTVHNISNDVVAIKSIVEGDQASSYTVTPSDVTIDVSDSAVFTVRFQPTVAGQHNAALWFTGPQCLLVDTVVMTGIKNSTVSFTASPGSLEYYSCDGQSQMDSSIVVKNTGSTSYTLDSGEVSGSGFTLVSPKGTVTLAPGDSIIYIIRFTPKQLDKYTGTFTVSGPCSTISKHDLIGWRTLFRVITPKNIDYGKLLCVQGYRDTIVTVKNTGGHAILVTATVEGRGFVALTSSAMVDVGSTKDFSIRFYPDSGGNFHAKLFFTSSVCPKQGDTIDLVGSKFSTTCISADQQILQFDTINCKVQSTGEDGIIKITNCSSTNQVALDSAQVTGKGFTLLDPLGKIVITPGNAQEYTIHFSPLGPGTYNGMFNVIGMPCYAGFSVPLIGVCETTSDVVSEKPSREDFWVGQNYPNPFRQSSVVSYQLSGERNQATFEIRDMLGRVVYRTSVSSTARQLTIDASTLLNGLYLYSLNDGINVQSRMMMVVK